MSKEKKLSEYNPKDYPDEWTNKQWVQWAYKLGLKLDKVIPFVFGYDNRWRIEKAIESLIESSAQAKEEPSEAEVEKLIKESGRAIWLMNFVKGGEELARQMFKKYDELRRG